MQDNRFLNKRQLKIFTLYVITSLLQTIVISLNVMKLTNKNIYNYYEQHSNIVCVCTAVTKHQTGEKQRESYFSILGTRSPRSRCRHSVLVSGKVLNMSSQSTGGSLGSLGSRVLMAEGCHRGLASVEILQPRPRFLFFLSASSQLK